ncbi:MAG TPA: hypothetical protein VNH40_13170 [Gaiellaceae bacterium]|nr:hypothetical protein [Gaiellaceae bacterium]
MLGELETRDLEVIEPVGGARRRLTWLRVELSARGAVALLTVLAAVSVAVHALLAGVIHGPFVFMDELGYERMAQSFAHTGHLALFGKGGLAYSPLYPILISPIYALTSSAHTAYEWTKVANAVLISLSVFPIYAIARFVLPRGRSIGVAALSLVAPLMLYSSFEMSESVSYPLFLVAIWAMLRALRRPSLGNDALLLGTILLACTARLQHVALFPVALTAVVLVALLRPDRPEDGRIRSLGHAVVRHRLLFGSVGLAFVAGLVRTIQNGGALPLAGRYSNVGTARANPVRVLEIGFHHLAELDFAVGVIPFACALLAGYALVRFGFPRNALIFASVAVGATAWLLLEVAFDAAAFDATSATPRPGSILDLPRIHERYLIYLVPLFLVALLVALPLARAGISPRHQLAIAAAAAVLPPLIPFHSILNSTSAVDSFALQAFATVEAGNIVPIPHPTLLAVTLAALLAFGYFRAFTRPFPQIAVAMTVVALVGMSLLELNRQIFNDATPATLGVPAQSDWVDRAVGGHADVAVVGGAGVQPIALQETAFWNLSVSRVYYTCTVAFGGGFGEERATLDGATGELGSPSGAIHARYVVAPAKLGLPGRVLARDKPGGLVLTAPAGGGLIVPAENRSTLRCAS